MNVKAGDRAEVINSMYGNSVGQIVKVLFLAGHHSRLGPIWTCTGEAEALTDQDFNVGDTADFADAWLRKLPDDQQFKSVTTTKEKEILR